MRDYVERTEDPKNNKILLLFFSIYTQGFIGKLPLCLSFNFLREFFFHPFKKLRLLHL